MSVVLVALVAVNALSVSVSVDGKPPVLGVDEEALVRITVVGPGPDMVDPPRVLASAGTFAEVTRTGPRAFLARYRLPMARFPQAAMLVAEIGAGSSLVRGFLALPLAASASPAFHTDPGAQVTMRVGDKPFGPQRADREGNVRVPVIVPPGVPTATARSVNRFGKATEQTVDLKIPSFRHMMIAAPQTMAAGDTVEVAVYGVTASGALAESRNLMLRSNGPKPHPLGGAAGEARFLVRAPSIITARALKLEAGLRGQETEAAFEVSLVPAAPARMGLEPDRRRLAIGVGSSMRVYLTAEDRFGNPTDARAAAVRVDGRDLGTRTDEDGRVMAVVNAPDTYDGRSRLQFEAALGGAYAEQTIPLANLPRAPRIGPDERTLFAITPRLGFVWNLRQPPGPAALIEVVGRHPRWPTWLGTGLAVGLLATEFVAQDPAGVARTEVRQVPVLALARVRRRVMPGLVVAAGIELGASFASARVHSFGSEVVGHAWGPAVALDAEVAAAVGPGLAVIGARYVHVRLGRLSSGDRLLGNSAGLIGDLGYRLAW